MKSIKVTTKTVDVEGHPTTMVTTDCLVRPGVNVGSITCRNCFAFSGYDEGKVRSVLCNSEHQALGAFVRD